MKSVALHEAGSQLSRLFDEAQAGNPILLQRGDQFVRLERVEPSEFGGNPDLLEGMLLDAVRGPHADWSPKDLEDIARRVRGQDQV